MLKRYQHLGPAGQAGNGLTTIGMKTTSHSSHNSLSLNLVVPMLTNEPWQCIAGHFDATYNIGTEEIPEMTPGLYWFRLLLTNPEHQGDPVG